MDRSRRYCDDGHPVWVRHEARPVRRGEPAHYAWGLRMRCKGTKCGDGPGTCTRNTKRSDAGSASDRQRAIGIRLVKSQYRGGRTAPRAPVLRYTLPKFRTGSHEAFEGATASRQSSFPVPNPTSPGIAASLLFPLMLLCTLSLARCLGFAKWSAFPRPSPQSPVRGGSCDISDPPNHQTRHELPRKSEDALSVAKKPVGNESNPFLCCLRRCGEGRGVW